MSSFKCPFCGAEAAESDVYCGVCGSKLPEHPCDTAAPGQNRAEGRRDQTEPSPDQTEPSSDVPRFSGDRLPPPLSTFDYLLMLLLFCVPFLGAGLALFWSFAGEVNPNRRNLSRAVLLCYAVILVAFGLLALMLYSLFSARTGV